MIILDIALALFISLSIAFADFQGMESLKIDTHLCWTPLVVAIVMLSAVGRNQKHVIISIYMLAATTLLCVYLAVNSLLYTIQDYGNLEKILNEFPQLQQESSNTKSPILAQKTSALNPMEDKNSFYVLLLCLCILALTSVYLLVYSCITYTSMNTYYEMSRRHRRKFQEDHDPSETLLISQQELLANVFVKTHNDTIDVIAGEELNKTNAGYGKTVRYEAEDPDSDQDEHTTPP